MVAHDSTNLTEGTGGPQDASVLYTAEDVLADLAGADLEVVRGRAGGPRGPGRRTGTRLGRAASAWSAR